MSSKTIRELGPIVGLSEFSRVSGSPTPLGDDVWVPILTVSNISKTTRIHGIKMVFSAGTPINPTYRISAKRQEDDNYRVVAPYASDGQDLVDAKTDSLATPIHLPKGASYKVEVRTDTASGASAQVEFLNIIEFTS